MRIYLIKTDEIMDEYYVIAISVAKAVETFEQHHKDKKISSIRCIDPETTLSQKELI